MVEIHHIFCDFYKVNYCLITVAMQNSEFHTFIACPPQYPHNSKVSSNSIKFQKFHTHTFLACPLL